MGSIEAEASKQRIYQAKVVRNLLTVEFDRMRKVVDSNYLQTESLRKYLSRSNQNFVVFTDYVAMEAYKGNALKSIQESMRIVARYPKQVIVLKGTQSICALKGRRAGLQRRMIDQDQTRGFAKFCKALRAVGAGDKGVVSQVQDHAHEASAFMGNLLTNMSDMTDIFADVSKTYTDEEIRIFRRGLNYTDDIVEKILRSVATMSIKLFTEHPKSNRVPDSSEAINTFIFRYALCGYLLFLLWVSDGGEKNVKPEKIRNDIIDIGIAAYATFFDGILTNDKKLKKVYYGATDFIEALSVTTSRA